PTQIAVANASSKIIFAISCQDRKLLKRIFIRRFLVCGWLEGIICISTLSRCVMRRSSKSSSNKDLKPMRRRDFPTTIFVTPVNRAYSATVSAMSCPARVTISAPSRSASSIVSRKHFFSALVM
ncbi:conserved hypothetical protein, partial [Listeria innocua FSL S4-378]